MSVTITWGLEGCRLFCLTGSVLPCLGATQINVYFKQMLLPVHRPFAWYSKRYCTYIYIYVDNATRSLIAFTLRKLLGLLHPSSSKCAQPTREGGNQKKQNESNSEISFHHEYP